MAKVNLSTIREKSLAQAAALGYSTNPNLPNLDVSASNRSQDEVADRALTLECMLAVAFGFPREQATQSLQQENLLNALADSEKVFLETPTASAAPFTPQVERLWALAWALGLIKKLDFRQYCGEQLVHLFPDLKTNQSSKEFRTRIRLRSLPTLLQTADLAYCIHWAHVDATLKGIPLRGKLETIAIRERRWALDWLVGSESWDDISLDN